MECNKTSYLYFRCKQHREGKVSTVADSRDTKLITPRPFFLEIDQIIIIKTLNKIEIALLLAAVAKSLLLGQKQNGMR